MRRCIACWVGCGLVVMAAAPAWAQAPYSVPRTPWGDPDLQAIWSGDSAFGIPLQRPAALGTKAELTDAEFAQKLERDERTRKNAENAVGSFRNDNSWLTRSFRQTSLVVDPPDGRTPPLVTGAEARRTPPGTYGNGPFDAPQDFTLYDRCITLGVIGSMTPTIYGNGYRIVQAPGYAVIMAEMIHEARVIPLDGRAHAGPGIRSYMGDSRGHWEGDTLVIETTNFNGNATSPAGYQVLPYECHEGNLAILQGLGGERAEDRAVEEDRKKGIIRPRRPIQGGLTVGGQPVPESGPPASQP